MAKARKAAAAEGGAEAAEVPAAAPETGGEAAPALKLKGLIDRVVARSGAKKKDAKAVVEATLACLGEALSKGEALNLPEFGKAKVNRTKDAGGGETLIVKLRRGGPKAVKVAAAAADDAAG